MSRKERQFAKSQEWLAWLSDSPATNPTPTPKSSQPPLRTEWSRASTTSQLAQERTGHNLGLSSDMFANRASTPSQRAARAPRRSLRTPSQPVHAVNPAQATASHDETIAIRIDLPKIHLPKITIPWAKILRWGVPALVLVALLALTPTLLRMRAQHTEQTKKTTSSTQPSFAPIKPAADTSSTVKNTQYDSQKQLYMFQDTYLGHEIHITEQSLPDALRTDKSKLANIAEKSIGAKDKFTTVYGDVYISTNEEQGIQRMVLQHRQLLVFILSKGILDNSQWVTYIQNLQ